MTTSGAVATNGPATAGGAPPLAAGAPAGMARVPIEVMLARQWASYLTVPILVLGAASELVYFNEATAALLGRRYDEMGILSLPDLPALFALTTVEGVPLTPETTPAGVAWRTRRPVHNTVRLRGLDGVWRLVAVTAVPMTGPADQVFGVVVFVWEALGRGP